MRKSKQTKEEREEFFLSWAKSEHHYFSEILFGLPTLSRLFDLDKSFTINILDDYGKGSLLICTIRGQKIVSHLFLDDVY